jgi:hypothetical protein
MKYFVYIAIFTLLLPVVSYAQDDRKHNHTVQFVKQSEQKHHGHEIQVDEKKAQGVEMLSHVLRHLLVQEMQALQTGMMSIIPAYVSGDWGKIENTARKMNNSYILKQNLTESQMHELHTLLPQAFIEKDQSFHYLAGMLEHAAKNKKPELINFYFSEMNESCVSCHTQFAKHRFPALISTEKEHNHGH